MSDGVIAIAGAKQREHLVASIKTMIDFVSYKSKQRVVMSYRCNN